MASNLCGVAIENGATVKITEEQAALARKYSIAKSTNEAHFEDGSWFIPVLV